MASNTANERTVSDLQSEIGRLTILLNNELASQQISTYYISNLHETCQAWEYLYNKLKAELAITYTRLCDTERKAQQLQQENQRLNLAMNHLVRIQS